jgi:hypothetical protein
VVLLLLLLLLLLLGWTPGTTCSKVGARPLLLLLLRQRYKSRCYVWLLLVLLLC